MSAPDIKTLDFAWLGCGVFANTAPKVDTTTLDYASLDSGVFVVTGGSVSSYVIDITVTLTCSSTKLLSPEIIKNIVLINAPPLTCSHTRITNPTTNAIFGMDLEVEINFMAPSSTFNYDTDGEIRATTNTTINMSNYDGVTACYFELVGYAPDSTNDAVYILYDLTNSADITTITIPHSTGTLAVYSSTSFSLTGNAVYQIRKNGSTSGITSAKVIIVQKNATKTRVQVPLISSHASQATGVNSNYAAQDDLGIQWLKTEANWEQVTSCNIEGTVAGYLEWNSDTIGVCLFNKTDNTQITSSEVTASPAAGWRHIIGNSFSWNASNFHDGDIFELRSYSSGSSEGEIAKLFLYITLTNLHNVEISKFVASLGNWLGNEYDERCRPKYNAANYSRLLGTYWETICCASILENSSQTPKLMQDDDTSGTSNLTFITSNTHNNGFISTRQRSSATLTNGKYYIQQMIGSGSSYFWGISGLILFMLQAYQKDVVATVNAVPLTAQHAKILAPEVTATTQHSGQVDAVPLTATHTQLLAPTLPTSKYIASAVLTAQHAKILSPALAVGIKSSVLTAQHTKLLAPTVGSVVRIVVEPLTIQQAKLLAPAITSTNNIAAPILTAQHAKILAPSLNIVVLSIEIERRIGASGEWVVINSGYWNGATYEIIDTDLIDGTIYYYRAHMYDGESWSYSNTNVIAYLGGTISLTASHTKLLAPTVASIARVDVPCLTASHAKLLAPNITLLANVQIDAPILTAQNCKLNPPSIISTSILDATVMSVPLTASHAKILAPNLVVVSIISAPKLTCSAVKLLAPNVTSQKAIDAVPLTASHAKILSPSITSRTQIDAPILTTSHAKLLAPSVIQSQIINVDPLTAQHTKLLAPSIGSLTAITAPVLTASHAQLLAPIFVAVQVIQAVPLTASHAKILNPNIVVVTRIAAAKLTCSHARILAPQIITARSVTISLNITIHCSHCKLLAPAPLVRNPAVYSGSFYTIGPDVISGNTMTNEIYINYPDGSTAMQYIVAPYPAYQEDPSLYEKLWYKMGEPFKVDLTTYDINKITIDNEQEGIGTVSKVNIDGETCLKLQCTGPGGVGFPGSEFWIDLTDLVSDGYCTYSMKVKFVIPGTNDKEWGGSISEYISGASELEDKYFEVPSNWYTWQERGIDWTGVRRQCADIWSVPVLGVGAGFWNPETVESAYILVKDIIVQEWRKIEDLQACAFFWEEGKDITRPSASIIDKDMWFNATDGYDYYLTDFTDPTGASYEWDYDNPDEVVATEDWKGNLKRDWIFQLSDNSLLLAGEDVRSYTPLPQFQFYHSTNNGATWNYIGGHNMINFINSSTIYSGLVDNNDTYHYVEFASTTLRHLKATYSNGTYTFGTPTIVHTFTGCSCWVIGEIFLQGDNIMVFWYNRTARQYHMTAFNKDTDSYTDEVFYTVPSSYSIYNEEAFCACKAFYTGGMYHIIIQNMFTTGGGRAEDRVFGPAYYIKGTSGSWSTPMYICNMINAGEFFNPAASVLSIEVAGAYDNKIYFFLGNWYHSTTFNDVKLFYIENTTMKELPLILTEPLSADWWGLMDATVTTDGKLVSAWWGPGATWQWQQGYTHAYLSCLDLTNDTYRGDNTIISAHLLLDIPGFYGNSWDEGRVVTPCNFKVFSRVTWEDDAIWNEIALNKSNLMGVIEPFKGEQGHNIGSVGMGPRVPKAIKYPGKYSRL